jgi:hypothetical protein
VLQLATLPSLGRIYCRTDLSRVALGLRVYANAQSAAARFRAGSSTVDRDYDDPTAETVTSWFPFHRVGVQWLAAVAGGENGYTLGIVRVDFRSGGCDFYDPPRVTVQIYPRRYAGQAPTGRESILTPWPIR